MARNRLSTKSSEEDRGVHLKDNSGVDLYATVYGGQNDRQ